MTDSSDPDRSMLDRAKFFLKATAAFIMFTLIGLILGFTDLALQPVSLVNQIATDKQKENTVYLIRGQKTNTSNYRSVESQLLQGASSLYRLTEGDLNKWSSDRFGSTQSDKEGFIIINKTSPDFRISDDELQISSRISVVYPDIPLINKLKPLEFFFHCKGQFVKGDKKWEFVPGYAYIGSAPLPKYFFTPFATSRFIKSFDKDNDFATYDEMWSGLDSVRIKGSELILQIN